MKVVATGKYKELNLKAKEVNKIPEEGEVFEIEDDKFEILNGNNKYNAIFVKQVIEKQEIPDKAIEKIQENIEKKVKKTPSKKAVKKKTK